VYVLLERRATAAPLLQTLEAAFHARVPLAIATVLDGAEIGSRSFAGRAIEHSQDGDKTPTELQSILKNMALRGLERAQSIDQRLIVDDRETRIWIDYRAARPGLWLFGAGDDARPIVQLARQLGWFVTVTDGRSHLATRDRFPAADSVATAPIELMPLHSPSALADLKATDAVVLVTHSFDQDARIMASLLARDGLPAYVGVLGPQRRTREVLAEAARLLGLEGTPERIEQWLAQLHAPTGLDIGAETPAAIALSIIAEIQQALNNGSALPLRQVRAVQPAMPSQA